MKYVPISLFILVLSSGASAQTTVVVDTSSYVPTVTASDDVFVDMCFSFAKKLGQTPVPSILTFKPKVMPAGQDEKSGSVWVLGHMGQQVEIAQSELPTPLRKLHGAVARNVLQASCYTENMMFFGRRDVVIITVDKVDADAVANALR
ncbi:MAG: hypothetical protein CEO12_433 [Parcubacteria group bacterium Gr01-1014_46]|nr:MAG: hypothetical protein CEO12_433 [Parcubacteria group bacterium Gr01-1014_46]